MRLRLILLSLILMPIILFSQTVVTITDASIEAGQQVTWTSDKEYLLDGLVFVEENAALTIQAGTVIRGIKTPTTGDNTSALIIARGGKIMAVGTRENPIIFTAENDDLNDLNDLPAGGIGRGQWGGVILLGYAGLNTTTGVGQIEGIDPNNPKGKYGGGDQTGGPNDNDNSGVIRYVSIRHGGSEIGAGNEINGLTMGGVGDGTVLEYIEVFANLDDGYEWFGGTVNTKYLVAAYCGDDAYDYDEGFRGKGQFWFAIQGTDNAGRIGEHDGGTTPEDGTPIAIPYIANATYIGPGSTVFPEGDGDAALQIRDNAGGKYYNSIFTEYNGANGGAGVLIEDLASGSDSRERLEAGDLVLNNNIWWDFANGNTLAGIAPEAYTQAHLTANNNQIVDPQLASINRTNAASFNPKPSANGPAASGSVALNDAFFTITDYFGAFDPNGALWIGGWTELQADLTTSVEELSILNSTVPTEFSISQNYPNPFNPSTEIQFDLAKPSEVKLVIYSLAGREVETLVNEVKSPGRFLVRWNASNHPSGIYFYQFKGGEKNIVRKMMLVK